MKASTRIVVVVLLCFAVLAGNACLPSNSSPPVVAQEKTPLTTRTGIPAIDKVLAAIETDDPQELSSMISYTMAPCTTAEGLGGPPKCRDGEPEGTMLEVLPFLGSEGSFIRKGEINTWNGVSGRSLYAIYRVSENAPAEEYYPSGEYAILLVSSDAKTAVSLRIGNDGIIRVDELFDGSPDALDAIMQRDASEVIFGPKIR